MVKVVDFSALDHSTISPCGCMALSGNVDKPSPACGCVRCFSRDTPVFVSPVFVPLTDPFVSIPVKRKTE